MGNVNLLSSFSTYFLSFCICLTFFKSFLSIPYSLQLSLTFSQSFSICLCSSLCMFYLALCLSLSFSVFLSVNVEALSFEWKRKFVRRRKESEIGLKMFTKVGQCSYNELALKKETLSKNTSRKNLPVVKTWKNFPFVFCSISFFIFV